MGLLDVITGKRKLAQPAPDRLFAISTAYVSFETSLDLTSKGTAAIVFQSLATADFRSIVKSMEELVSATARDSSTTVSTAEDEYGFSWLILKQSTPAQPAAEGSGFEDLVVGLNAVATELEGGGYGDRLLCAVFAFQDSRSRPVYWIYNFKRGSFYPFVPGGGPQQRDTERELVLKAQIGSELPIEAELQRWFPLWGIPI